jgi:hypothetical protein
MVPKIKAFAGTDSSGEMSKQSGFPAMRYNVDTMRSG